MFFTWPNIKHEFNTPAYLDIPGEDRLVYKGNWVTLHLPMLRADNSLGQEV